MVQQQDKRIDEAVADSFPASDPPSNTPVTGVANDADDAEQSRRQERETRIRAAEAKERERDPHGVAPAAAADEDEPAGSPTSDRHRTETTIGRLENRRRGQTPDTGRQRQ